VRVGARVPHWHGPCSSPQPSVAVSRRDQAEEQDMRERIEGDWNGLRARVRHEWARLTDEHLDEIDGRRDRLRQRVRDVYGVTDDEADKQIDAWEHSLRHDVEPAPRLDSDPGAYPPAPHASATWNGTVAATETRNERRDPEPDWVPTTGTPRTGTAGVFENEGEEFGEHDRPGGAGMPGNQGGGRDPGPVPAERRRDGRESREVRDSGASAGGRSPGDVAAGGSPSPPGPAGRGSG
jgi:uncharacterized protein YjbJ (UPF0337 family)